MAYIHYLAEINFLNIGWDILVILAFIIGGILLDRLTIWLLDHIYKKSQKKATTSTEKASDNKSDTPAKTPKLPIFVNALKKPLHVFCITVGCSLGVLFIDTPQGAEEFFKIIHNFLWEESMCVII